MPTFQSSVQNQLRVDVEGVLLSQNIALNQSTIAVRTWLNGVGRSLSAPIAADVSLNGTPYGANTTHRDIPMWGGVLVAEAILTVNHAANGTSTITIGGYAKDTWRELINQIAGGSWTLPTIPRATTPNIDGETKFVTGTAQTINLPRHSSNFTHDVTYKVGSKTGTIATGAGVTTSWTPAHDLITDAETRTAEITVVTKQGSTVIGSPQKRSWPLDVAASVVPTVSAVAWDDLNPVVKTVVGAFVQGQSLIKGAVTAAGSQGSTITSKHLILAGAQVAEEGVWQPDTPGTVVASGHAVDSRGRSASKAANFGVLAYTPPVFPQPLLRRATSALGTIGDGEWLRLDLTAQVQSLINGTERNSLHLLVRTRLTGGSWITRNNETLPNLAYTDHLVMVGGDDAYPLTQGGDVEVTVTDALGNKAVRTLPFGTGGASFDIAGSGTGHGKIHSRGAIDAAGTIYTDADVDAAGDIVAGGVVKAGTAILSPLGSVTQWLTDTPPAGWLLCHGQAISRTTYAALFALIGTTYGAGNGSSTFNLPDLQGRVPVGKSSDTEFNTLGKTFGTKTHTLTIAEIPNHSHSSPGTYNVGPGAGATAMVINAGVTGHTTGVGGGGAHNNIQPSIALNYIIRAL